MDDKSSGWGDLAAVFLWCRKLLRNVHEKDFQGRILSYVGLSCDGVVCEPAENFL